MSQNSSGLIQGFRVLENVRIKGKKAEIDWKNPLSLGSVEISQKTQALWELLLLN